MSGPQGPQHSGKQKWWNDKASPSHLSMSRILWKAHNAFSRSVRLLNNFFPLQSYFYSSLSIIYVQANNKIITHIRAPKLYLTDVK